jgi:drug/metabolite transporter (DMT)-like permease
MLHRARQLSADIIGRASARFLLFASALNFGLMAALTRLTTHGGFTAGQIAVVRFGVGILLTLGLFAGRPGTWAPVNKGLLITRGALGGLAAFLYFVSLARISAVQATLLNNCFPILATAFAFFALRERPTLHLVIGIVMASIGVFFVLGGGTAHFTLGWGELAGIVSACFAAGAVLAIRRLRATDNAPTIFFAFCVGGFAVSCPFALEPWPAGFTLWVLALVGVGGTSFAAQLLMTQAYGRITVPEAAVWQQLTPLASYLWAMLLLGERLSHLGVAGVLLGIVGVIYGSIFGQKRPDRAAPSLES